MALTNSPNSQPKRAPASAPTEERPARNWAAEGLAYAERVGRGEELVSKWVRLACERHLRDLAAAAAESYPYRFDESKANRAAKFISHLPHTKGDWAKQADNRITLEAWQCFMLSAIFGWVKKSSGLRRFRRAYICIPRKNGKTLIAAGVGLYMLSADGEYGAEVYCGATSKDQAWEVFEPAKLMIERSPRLRDLFGVRPGSENLYIAQTGSKMEPIIGNPGDGASPSCAITDEYHEHRSNLQVDAMHTGMGARSQPLGFIITTAGSTLGGPCHLFQRDCERMLDGTAPADDLFALIYTVDAEDDWTSELALRKANPNYGVSVDTSYLASQQQQAIQAARKQNTFKTKHLNVWVGANVAWLNMQKWAACADPRLTPAACAGLPCFMGADLSSKLDLASVARVYRKRIGKLDHYYVFGRHYCPEVRTREPELEKYAGWAIEGHLTTTPGQVIDYQTIADQALVDIREAQASEFGFDPWNAEKFAQDLVKAAPGLVAVEVPIQARYLSEPMKQLEALILDGRLHHDGDPVLAWCLGNVVAHADAKDNIFPNKEHAESKIDAALALLLAFSRALVSAPKVSVYASRGVLTL